ncbi:hypothetical protein [Glycomyces albidus]|jgi:hypothetical protein|uniref:Uncharacterized protein n=1 Tax=Glycomyces albidus TaxID=2656774 RepID=A0A6L5GD97_9ACTN|nr:hypothetical protein [Glycomyces albidus]MQM27672.1 hypothetical protein [Glycomyces albidus]
MVQQVETAPVEASEPSSLPNDDLPGGGAKAEVPASPASLWASESRGHYSITHTDRAAAPAWVDCDCVIHSD